MGEQQCIDFSPSPVIQPSLCKWTDETVTENEDLEILPNEMQTAECLVEREAASQSQPRKKNVRKRAQKEMEKGLHKPKAATRVFA